MAGKEQQWLLTHDSHELKKGEVYKGETLPLWLVGKAIPVGDQVLEVATPADLQKLQADLDEANGKVESLTAGNAKLQAELDEANGKVESLTAGNAKLQAELDEAQKQIDELKKKAK
ncbi:hypothetical protein [Klebsiella pneumoniae]|jgi:peptidoglycan hydrolase CwlO-like protein|uniref:hypothetical protein n=1 Tax=Klebsiella pneumoniae TaxID=573 RepID=UPI0007CA55EC|nr:hypothetical protein [Klebsiella pneumoniae]MCB6156586.1 hypothetical protein [Klebsiella pneumoniae]MCB6187960.1 hypothetical protein [Klebsiella pneumoniae]MDN6919560.1 hypothetical protein [Klebsiella pneumoniae]MDU9117863.1 hypothetical protein [Klebsiella pneumoniae]OKN11640.1 hypothetical protein AM337_000552 [Klebsiella pneumoniae]